MFTFVLGANSPTSSAPPRCPSACATAGARSTTCWPRTGTRTRWWARGSGNALLCSRCCFWIWQKIRGVQRWWWLAFTAFLSFVFACSLLSKFSSKHRESGGDTFPSYWKSPPVDFSLEHHSEGSEKSVWGSTGWDEGLLYCDSCIAQCHKKKCIHPFFGEIVKKGINSNSVHLLSSCVISWFMLVKNVFLTG